MHEFAGRKSRSLAAFILVGVIALVAPATLKGQEGTAGLKHRVVTLEAGLCALSVF